MTDQIDIFGNSQPITWDGEPILSPDTVKEGLFDPDAFTQMRGQTAMDPQCEWLEASQHPSYWSRP